MGCREVPAAGAGGEIKFVGDAGPPKACIRHLAGSARSDRL